MTDTNTKQQSCAELVRGAADRNNAWLVNLWRGICGDSRFKGDTDDGYEPGGDDSDYAREALYNGLLGIDYVAAGTFDNQKFGYWRVQLSYGGPTEEYRITRDESRAVRFVEFWYLNWFDGASVDVNDNDVLEVLDHLLEGREHNDEDDE